MAGWACAEVDSSPREGNEGNADKKRVGAHRLQRVFLLYLSVSPCVALWAQYGALVDGQANLLELIQDEVELRQQTTLEHDSNLGGWDVMLLSMGAVCTATASAALLTLAENAIRHRLGLSPTTVPCGCVRYVLPSVTPPCTLEPHVDRWPIHIRAVGKLLWYRPGLCRCGFGHPV